MTQLSQCCGAAINVIGGSQLGVAYKCSACHKPCDVKPTPEVKDTKMENAQSDQGWKQRFAERYSQEHGGLSWGKDMDGYPIYIPVSALQDQLSFIQTELDKARAQQRKEDAEKVRSFQPRLPEGYPSPDQASVLGLVDSALKDIADSIESDTDSPNQKTE